MTTPGPILQCLSAHKPSYLIFLLQLLSLQLKFLTQLCYLLAVIKLEGPNCLLVCQLLLLELLLQVALVLAQATLIDVELILLQFERQLSICLQRCDVVLMFVQQVLDLLFVHL